MSVQLSKTSSNTQPRNFDKRNFLPHWVIRLVFSCLLIAVLFHWVDMDSFWSVIHSADIVLLSVAVFLFFPGKLLDAYRWYFVLKKLGRFVPFWSVVRHNVVGQLSTFFLPGQLSGDAVRLIAVAQGQPKHAEFVLSVLIDKLALLIAVAAFSFLGLLGSGPVSFLRAVYAAAAVIIVVVFLIFVCLCQYRNQCSSPVPNQERINLPRRLLSRCSEWLSVPRLSRQATLTVLALGLLLQFLYTIGSFILALSMHIVIDPIEWAAINAIVAFVQILPITVGGLGVREGVLGAILSLYAVPLTQSIAFSLISFMLVVILAALCWLALNMIVWTKRIDTATQ